MSPKKRLVEPKTRSGFDVHAYLDSTGPARTVVKYRRGEVVFSQGDRGDDIRYIQKGAIKLSVLSRIGKEAVVAMLGAGDFFGEGALAGQLLRIGTATAFPSACSRSMPFLTDPITKLAPGKDPTSISC